MGLTNWMAWENGVDLVGSTIPGGTAPNLIIHVARLVQINGMAIAFELLPVGISGGAPAVWSPAGVYAR
jgi:hypothetical protein